MQHLSTSMRRPVAGFLLFLLWLAGPAARAQAPAWQSATSFAPTNAATYTSLITATATDAAGNVYVAGYFTGTATFGSTTLTSAGNSDVFVGKWDPRTAVYIWVQRVGGTGADAVNGIAVSGSSVYLTGYFTGAVSFGSISLTAAGSTDAFVAKLTDAGPSAGFAWAQAGGGTGSDTANALAVGNGSMYVAGYFTGTATFGGSAVTAAGNSDAFVAKFTDNGPSAGFAWVQRGGSTLADVGYGVAVRGSSVYLSGFLSSNAAFGPVTLVGAGGSDAFVAKLTDAGSSAAFVWALAAGGPNSDFAFAVTAGPGSSLYVVGRFDSSTANFGPTTLTNANPTSTTVADAFVAKINDAGTTGAFVWAQAAGGPAADLAANLAVSGANVYAVGHYQGAATFGSTTLTSTGSANSDVFVTKLVDAGATSSFAWTQTGGSTGIDLGYGLALNGSTVYATGSLVAPATFGATTVSGSFGGAVGYLASLTDPTLTATTAANGALSFSLAPNPARTAITVQLPAVPGAPTATLTLTDALGRTLRTETVALPAAGLRHELALSGLAPGLYAVQVQAGAATATQRLVVD
ncbi:T9SS type A sorting domain-containing protein [Hymenobacter convexus]|uniref:T9SS type A sorting domain-containing protein n=1 Tax=Hymenobacter sp. CA1UV-4 TaxID=3063782 RepID=UPI00271411B6|nr:T9SS type A sorting domain-containing protein [Hymenobacter sp. CA1UV-4]MDO7851202.1 T9SS type A sorting domain-containing protein [Hymenobacter sp. CA1UV-4]